ncbi:MAG: ABC transporter ATP-binding protein [Burkholderiales bacterium]|nr:ABC transporter ATP-binding protein [Burkholderiales bacterium]
MANALEVTALDVVYGGTLQVLRGLSLAVPEGRVVTLLGSNGAGKTTTLKAITGLLPLEHGEIAGGQVRFAGADTTRLAPHLLARRGLFHVREGRQLFTDMTVEENLIAACNALGTRHPAPPDFEEVYGFFPRLKERARQVCGYLSGGEQQMLAIGRALVAKPRVILFDEPSLGLAPKVVAEIFGIIRRINAATGVAMLIVEQNARVALAHADYGYILESGAIMLEGEAARLATNPDVKNFYLGGAEGGRRSFRDVKHYRGAKRWLN